MTRINSAINPRNLTDQHLIAELRELPRIFTAVNKRIEKDKSFDDIPNEFCLGTGHTKFFYNKCQFLYVRHSNLRIEYQFRFDKEYSFKVDKLDWVPNNLFKGYDSTQEEKQLLIDRISTRINESNQVPRYYGKQITKLQAIDILKFGKPNFRNMPLIDNMEDLNLSTEEIKKHIELWYSDIK